MDVLNNGGKDYVIEITSKEFEVISNYMRNNYGIKLGESKKSLVKGRLQNLLSEKNIESFSEYYDYIVSDKSGQAATEIVNKLTTNYTYFLREPNHFKFLTEQALPYFFQQKSTKELLFWSAGCSSGEEAYTIGMVLKDYMKTNKQISVAKILATDISNRTLEVAKNAQYSNVNFNSLPNHWESEYFKVNDDGTVEVDYKIKSMVKLAYLNLNQSYFPIKNKFHFIFCRNVMIYFDNKSKDALVERFYDMLVPGGFLFIGHSESLNRENTRFKYIKPAIYRKDI